MSQNAGRSQKKNLTVDVCTVESKGFSSIGHGRCKGKALDRRRSRTSFAIKYCYLQQRNGVIPLGQARTTNSEGVNFIEGQAGECLQQRAIHRTHAPLGPCVTEVAVLTCPTRANAPKFNGRASGFYLRGVVRLPLNTAI
jgi:hypothetical protein